MLFVNRQTYLNFNDNEHMTIFGERLKQARLAAGLSQGELAGLVGIKQASIAEAEAIGKSSKKIIEYAKALKVNPEWLSTGKGKMHAETNDNLTINQYNDVRGAMGHGLVLRGETGQITGWQVTPEWINNNVPSNTGRKNLAIVTGFGDSMQGMFNSVDPLLVDTGVTKLEHDGVYFFRVGDEGFIKRLQRIPGEGIRAISTNKEYESWTIKADMDFEVFGRVLKVWKSEEF